MHRAFALIMLSTLALGCPTPTEETGGDDTGPDTTDPFHRYIDLTDEAVGDFSCYTPGDPWRTQTVDAEKVVTRTMVGLVEDFEDDIGVAEATLDVWFDDSFDGAPDATTESDSAGNVTIELPTCTALAYETSTPPELEIAKETYEAHQIYEYVDEGMQLDDSFNSVAESTYVLIPSLLGVSMDDDKSVVAGTAYDCSGGKIQNAQVIVTDGSDIPETLVVNYFVDDWPIRDQPHTSEDGLWVAMNVPEGEWEIQLWALIDGEEVQLGSTVLNTFADSINISNIYSGFGDGVKYPDACLAE